jgi:hypothetical protein
VNRLAGEMREDQHYAFGTPPWAGGPLDEKGVEEYQQRIATQAMRHQTRLVSEYNTRIAPQLGMLIEDAKDAGYDLPRSLRASTSDFPVNVLVLEQLARELGLTAEKFAARRVARADG